VDNSNRFKVSIISRDEATGDMLVSGDLERAGGGIVLRLSPSAWERLAESVIAFKRLAPAQPPEVA